MPRKKLLNVMSERRKRQDRKQNMQQISNRLDSKQDSNPTINTNHDQSVVVVKSETFDSDDDIPLNQVKRHIHINDASLYKRRKFEQTVYIKPEDCSPYPPRQYIKSEDTMEGSKTEVNDNFIIYEINEVNYTNDLNIESYKVLNNEVSEKSVPQCLPPPAQSENSIRVRTYSKTNRLQNATTLNKCTSNAIIPKIHTFLEISGTSGVKQKATSGRKIASTKIHGTPIKKVITGYNEVSNKCACRLNPMKNVDIHSNLELKDFFERMFEETRKLKIEGRQMVKTDLLKAVSQAEEDVDAGKFCEKCYTMLAQPKRRY